jgi:hypothetical protein
LVLDYRLMNWEDGVSGSHLTPLIDIPGDIGTKSSNQVKQDPGLLNPWVLVVPQKWRRIVHPEGVYFLSPYTMH